MKTSIITILFTIVLSAHAYAQGGPVFRTPTCGCPVRVTKGVKVGRVWALGYAADASFGSGTALVNGDQPVPATRKKAKIGKWVTTHATNDGVGSTFQDYRTLEKTEGGCIGRDSKRRSRPIIRYESDGTSAAVDLLLFQNHRPKPDPLSPKRPKPGPKTKSAINSTDGVSRLYATLAAGDDQEKKAKKTEKKKKKEKINIPIFEMVTPDDEILAASTQAFSQQCRVRDGGCIRNPFPPKKPKLPPIRVPYFDLGTATDGNAKITTKRKWPCKCIRPAGAVRS